MKKLVPFKKDISFNNNIDEINSISLEYEIDTKKDSLITGNFIVSGDYRMTSSSQDLDCFDYKLPFNINLDKKYYIDEADVDISDFYYEVINNKVLSVNIELTIENIEEREDLDMNRCVEVADTDPVLEENEVITEDKEEGISTNVKSLFDDLDTGETYSTYKIHIVTENDTIESIMTNYQVKREQIEAYNDVQEIKIGDKIIIPADED